MPRESASRRAVSFHFSSWIFYGGGGIDLVDTVAVSFYDSVAGRVGLQWRMFRVDIFM